MLFRIDGFVFEVDILIMSYISRLKYKIKYPSCSIMSGTRMSGNVQIGAYSYIGYDCSITEASIGRYCSIGDSVTIAPGEHLVKNISTSAYFYDDVWNTLTQKDSVIGNDVWIGTKAIILRGVRVGNGAIIGAGAIVTKDVPPYAVVVGVPAKVIYMRFERNEIDMIEQSKWWEMGFEDAKMQVAILKDKIDNNGSV